MPKIRTLKRSTSDSKLNLRELLDKGRDVSDIVIAVDSPMSPGDIDGETVSTPRQFHSRRLADSRTSGALSPTNEVETETSVEKRPRSYSWDSSPGSSPQVSRENIRSTHPPVDISEDSTESSSYYQEEIVDINFKPKSSNPNNNQQNSNFLFVPQTRYSMSEDSSASEDLSSQKKEKSIRRKLRNAKKKFYLRHSQSEDKNCNP